MWADMKKEATSRKEAADSSSESSASARVAAADEAAAALAREMEDAEAVFGDDDAPAPSPPAPPSPPAETATAALARTQRQTSEKEAAVRASLADSRARVDAEARRLALFESELQKLKVKEASDVGTLRGKLEDCDRDIVWLERDFKTKEALFVKARDALEAAQARKRTMHEHLALMVLSSEKRKEEKLDELERRMAGGDASDPSDDQLLG